MNRNEAESRPKILALDDEACMRDLLRRLLQDNFDIFLAADSATADDILTRNSDIHVLLCDHDLPGEKGLDFCKRLHHRHWPGVSVLVTGHGDLALTVNAINSRCIFSYVAKPFSMAEIRQSVDDALAEFQRIASLATHTPDEPKGLRQDKGFRRSCQVVFGVASLALGTLVLLVVAAVVLGAIGFILLYLLKSFLGIDIFQDRHLRDWF
jgi:DNA-binding NtrC family response regulator